MVAALSLAAVAAYGQPDGGVPRPTPVLPVLQGLAPFAEVPLLETPAVLPVASRAAAGTADRVLTGDRAAVEAPPRFADPFAVDLVPASHGLWEVTSDGRTAVWRLRVVSDGAVSLNFGFSRYRMPAGGRLRIHTPDEGSVLGPFTDADNEVHGQLWTPVLPGGEAVIEVVVPLERAAELEFELASVNRGFRDPGVLRWHAPCNVDVVCSAGDPWRDQIRSVAMYSVKGEYTCSGALLNTTLQDNTPYMLSADHCVENAADAASIVVYWNHQSTTCGTETGESLAHTQSGAYLRAKWEPSDMLLLELDDPPDPAYRVYFAGWDRRDVAPTSGASIHHPNGHLKSIALEEDHAMITELDWAHHIADGHFLFMGFETGYAERGSSGGPFFDQNKRVVAHLTAVTYKWCGQGREYYLGRFAKAWTGGGSSSNRLSDWLDPAGSGVSSVDGLELYVNQEPLPVGTLFDKALRLTDGAAGSLAVDVSHAFQDVEEDDLTYGATSSDESLVTVAVTGSVVTVSPVAAVAVAAAVAAAAHRTMKNPKNPKNPSNPRNPRTSRSPLPCRPRRPWSSRRTATRVSAAPARVFRSGSRTRVPAR